LTEPANPAAKTPMMSFRRSQKNKPRLEPEAATRQGEITRLAFLTLGREAAIAFLNTDNSELGGRPLDLATADTAGFARTSAELTRLSAEPGEA